MEKTMNVSKTNVNTREMVATALLLALGFILHAITPPLFFGIKPDFLLSCMFIAIIACPKSQNVLLAGTVSGIISAMTTGFPAGQIPSVIEKIATAYICFFIIQNIYKLQYTNIKIMALGLIGTLISGMIFLGSASIIAGLPTTFTALIITVVIPTAIINTFVTQIIYKAYSLSKKR